MNRSERRNLDRDLRKLMKKDGDRCTVCHVDLPHNSKTYYGRAEGSAAIVGECCRPRLSVEIGSGLYVQGDYDVLKGPTGGLPSSLPPQDVEATIAAVQKGVAGMDGVAASTKARAGLIGDRTQVTLKDTPWKSDDADWFRGHPDRSHRLRALLKGELESFPPGAAPPTLPAGHEVQVVIRQVEPGQRVRVPFGRNLETPIPDVEAVIHALFDSVAQRNGAGPNISVQEVAARAGKYARPPGRAS